jgi:hypothetical protein
MCLTKFYLPICLENHSTYNVTTSPATAKICINLVAPLMAPKGSRLELFGAILSVPFKIQTFDYLFLIIQKVVNLEQIVYLPPFPKFHLISQVSGET